MVNTKKDSVEYDGGDSEYDDSRSEQTRFDVGNEDFENENNASKISGDEDAGWCFDLDGGKSVDDDK